MWSFRSTSSMGVTAQSVWKDAFDRTREAFHGTHDGSTFQGLYWSPIVRTTPNPPRCLRTRWLGTLRRDQENSNISSDTKCEEPHAQDCDPFQGVGGLSDTDDDGSLDDFEEPHYMDLPLRGRTRVRQLWANVCGNTKYARSTTSCDRSSRGKKTYTPTKGFRVCWVHAEHSVQRERR